VIQALPGPPTMGTVSLVIGYLGVFLPVFAVLIWQLNRISR
jgi:uncharacterized membrane protein YbaN (DUF454 family)